MILLGELKDKQQIGEKYLETTYLLKNLFLKCIKNSQNLTIKQMQLKTEQKI